MYRWDSYGILTVFSNSVLCVLPMDFSTWTPHAEQGQGEWKQASRSHIVVFLLLRYQGFHFHFRCYSKHPSQISRKPFFNRMRFEGDGSMGGSTAGMPLFLHMMLQFPDLTGEPKPRIRRLVGLGDQFSWSVSCGVDRGRA